MAIQSELYGLKSAGTYRFEKDQSVTLTTVAPLENIRMLVGFSKKGPFNTPVLINTTKEFIDTFGDIDRSLEKKGAYFHRSCLAALSAGPIYCLNLLKLTDEDVVDVMKFSTSATCRVQTCNPTLEDRSMPKYSYRGMYNIDTFYTPSEESFLYTVGRSNVYDHSGNSTNDILDFTNIGKSPVSVIVTKASAYNASGFQVTAQEWYGKGNVPAFLHDTSYISDFMVDVYVLSGNWGGDFANEDGKEPYERFASDIKFSKYFDSKGGLIRRKNATDTTDTLFAQFLNEPDVNLIGKYTGCLIPGFVDKNGRNMYIEYLINSDTSTNGLMCAVNEQIFDGDVLIDGDANGIDLIGNSLYDAIEKGLADNVNYLSYNGIVTGNVSTNGEHWNLCEEGDGNTLTLIENKESGALREFEPIDGTSDATIGLLKCVFGSNDHKTFSEYVYYYDEKDGMYVEPSDEGTTPDARNAFAWGEIFNEVSNGKKVYMVLNGEGTSNKKLVPVTSIKKSYLYDYIDRTLPRSVKGDVQIALDAKYTDGASIKYTKSIMNSNPIVKYEVVLTSENAIEYTGSDIENVVTNGYVIASEFDKFNAAYNNNGKTAAVLFLEGTSVYENLSSIGTNDSLVISFDGDDYTNASVYDINWTNDSLPVKTIQFNNSSDIYEIANSNYAPDYVLALFNTKNGDNTVLDGNVATDDFYTFVDKKLAEGFSIVLGTQNLETTVVVYKEKNGVQAKPNEFIIPVNTNDSAYDCVKVGNYALSKYGDGHRLTRIVNITGVANEQGIVDYRLVACQDNVDIVTEQFNIVENESVNTLEIFGNLCDWFPYYNVFTLGGFKLQASHQPDGTNARQHEILDLLAENSEDSNLFNALIDRELIQFRYLVDTFGLGIEEMCKKQYTNLCKSRKSAFAIVNAPSCNDFKNSEDPSFVDKNKAVSAEFIAKGGDPNTNPSFLFSLPDKVNGSTWGGYYYPYLKVYSNYTTINVPPAAYVSNNYVAKYGSGMPWTVVAGQNRGVVSGNNVVGVEASLIRDNRDWLEPFGINSIIYENGVGCVIYANKTAQQNPQSALSSINVREVCIYIQDGIEKILRNYLFESNTAQTRLEIKTLVDNFLDIVKSNFGVYDFHTVMDTSNNTNEVIDKNMGVISVFVEPVRAMEILVQQLTILKTGAIESGTFE